MLKQIVFFATAATLMTVMASAQTPQPPTARPVVEQPGTPATPQPAQAQARPAEPVGQSVNVSIELTIAETGGTGPTRKMVSLIVADRQTGIVRSRSTVKLPDGHARDVSINVDARPTILREGSLRMDLSLDYQPNGGTDSGKGSTSGSMALLSEPASSNLMQRTGVILDSGKPLVISQAADPGSDRQITVTVKATILK